jgi:hypothetical protein
MTDFLTDSNNTKKKEPIIEYRQIEKETILVDYVFNMLFEMVEKQNEDKD